MKSFIIFFLFVSFLSFQTKETQAQVKFPKIHFSTFSSVSFEEYQPLWLTKNRWGFLDDYSRFNNAMLLSGTAGFNQEKEKFVDYAFGLEILARGSSSNSDVYLHQAFASIKASVFQVDVGRKEQTWGEDFGRMSTGTLVLGRNATPIPMINAAIPDFIPVPFTYKFIQFKGNLQHGWLEDSRYVKDTYLHQKTFYLQAGFDHWPVHGYGGMVHVVQWAGDSPSFGKLPSDFRDYMNIFFGKSANENDEDAPQGEINNVLGNHLGIWDFGLKGNISKYNFHVYWQHFFEDQSGLAFRNIGDGLFGIGILTKKKQLVSGALVEYVRTIKQTGAGLHGRPGDVPFCEEENCGLKYGGRDNYYNNFLYRSGWSYNGRILGNPTLLTNRQVETYLPGTKIYQPFVESNRLAAHHIALEGDLSRNVEYRLFTTYSLHYGNYRGLNFGEKWGSKDPAKNKSDYTFYPALKQWNFMLETTYSIESLTDLDFLTTIALDRGELTNNFGLMVGVNWCIFGGR